MKSQFILIKQSQARKAMPVIYLQVFDARFKDRKFLYSTRQIIDPKLWDGDAQAVKIRKAVNQDDRQRLDALDKFLKSIRNRVELYQSLKLNSNYLDKAELKSHLDGMKDDDRKDAEERLRAGSDFFKLWEKIIDTTRANGKAISEGTKRSKKQTLVKVTEFAAVNRLRPTLDTITKDFYTSFVGWLEGQGLKPNTCGKHVKELKAILREADDRGFNVNPSYLKKSFRVFREPAESTYLSIEELRKIASVAIKGQKAQHRDVFLQACFVGARHSDWHQIHPNNVEVHNGKELLRIKQQKTGAIIYVPIHPMVRRIWQRYKDSPPRVVARPKIAEAIREVAKVAELGKVVINGQRVDKYTTISTHTARRSFATNAYLSGDMTVQEIMKCTGHRTETSFLKYLKLDGRDFAYKASDSKFFSAGTWDEGVKMKIA
ncbi:MAG TPA: phage integrase SAM-like domain-containing protein [Cyclobacteriaceae bacterium]|nr:phage integrase SAM-like domain-containing protein [Cyclobacteriaceae bacterium]